MTCSAPDHLNGDDREKKIFYELGRADPTFTVDPMQASGSSPSSSATQLLGHLDGLAPPPYGHREALASGLHQLGYSGTVSPGPSAGSYIQMTVGGAPTGHMPYYLAPPQTPQQSQSASFIHPLQYGSAVGTGSLDQPGPPPPSLTPPGLQPGSASGGYGASTISGIRNGGSSYWYPPNSDSRFSSE